MFGKNGRQPSVWLIYEKIISSARSGIPSGPSSPHLGSLGGSGVLTGTGVGGFGGGVGGFSSFTSSLTSSFIGNGEGVGVGVGVASCLIFGVGIRGGSDFGDGNGELGTGSLLGTIISEGSDLMGT